MIPCSLAGSRYHLLKLAAMEEDQVWGLIMAGGATHAHA